MDEVDVILTEMCRRVGITLDDISDRYEKDSSWYSRHEWTAVEMAAFEKWLVDYLYSNKKARQEICGTNLRNKSYLRKSAKWFVFNYGWKQK